MTPTAYPLFWPQKFPRTVSREKGAFKTSLPAALANVERSLKMFAQDSRKRIEHQVISSNVTLGAQRPADPGVAIWFTWDGLSVCIPVDRYQTVEANLQAIHHVLEARRVELRHGTLALVRASFSGFAALPAPAAKSWRDVLDVPTGSGNRADQLARARMHYRASAAANHPDKGGDAARMAEINTAWAAAQAELQ